jgi:hypothetical protein
MFRNNDGLTTLRDLIHHSEDEIYASEIYASDEIYASEIYASDEIYASEIYASKFMRQTGLVLLNLCVRRNWYF